MDVPVVMVIRISRRDETGPAAQVTVAPWTGGGRRARPAGGLCGQRCVVLGDMRVRIDIVLLTPWQDRGYASDWAVNEEDWERVGGRKTP